MPAVVACPKCKKKFKLPDEMLGKNVKCPSCEILFKVPGPRSAASPANAQPQRQADARKQQAARAQAQALQAMGVQGNIERPADLFSGGAGMPGTADPLANHVIQDPGFGDGADIAIAPKKIQKSDNPYESMFTNPALEQKKTKKLATGKKGKKAESTSLIAEPWFWLTVTFLPLFLLSILFSSTGMLPESANAMFTFATYGLYALVSVGIGIWGFIVVYQVSESVAQLLLCIFIPFYMLYFLWKNWESMKSYGNTVAANVVISFIAGYALEASIPMIE